MPCVVIVTMHNDIEYVREAREAGSILLEGISVDRVQVSNGRVSGVVTDRGEIDCEVVINCAGMWAREVGRMCECCDLRTG